MAVSSGNCRKWGAFKHVSHPGGKSGGSFTIVYMAILYHIEIIIQDSWTSQVFRFCGLDTTKDTGHAAP
jgi:hypothetical protein